MEFTVFGRSVTIEKEICDNWEQYTNFPLTEKRLMAYLSNLAKGKSIEDMLSRASDDMLKNILLEHIENELQMWR